MNDDAERDAVLGAYGLRLRGVDLPELLVPAADAWPGLSLSVDVLPERKVVEHVADDRATLRLRTGGHVVVERAASRATYAVPRPLSADALVHPFLAPVAAVMAHWHGRESFHAGGVVAEDGVWGVVGDRWAGKSSTLAWLALGGHEIVADDLLVLERASTRVYAGPRSVDLRPESAALLGAGEALGVVGARERWRLRLEPVPGDLPLRGWIVLAWGDDVAVRPLGGAERVSILAAQRGLRVPPTDPTVFLDLAALPCWELRRPHQWSSLEAAARLLLDTVVR